MAGEIIIGERRNGEFSCHFLYSIPANDRIEIGGYGTTGEYPVLTPTSGMDATVLAVLTQAEKDALDAGESVLLNVALPIPEDATDQEVLALMRDYYSGQAQDQLDKYTHRYKYIGRRFDKA